MIGALEIRPYRLPLARAWRSARGVLCAREGWLVSIRCGGRTGYGDCAPMPEAGTEAPSSALAALERWRALATVINLEVLRDRLDLDRAPTPAARYAVECALLDLGARRDGVPLRRLLKAAAPAQVEVNDALGPLAEATPVMVRSSCQAGFRVLKLKLGLEAPEVELMRLEALAPHLAPGAAFRLDANGAWDLREAADMIECLNALPVESLEEPLRNPRAADLRRLQAAAEFPIALDESLHLNDPAIGLASLPVSRVVLKPAVVGGIGRTLRLGARLARQGVEVVTTSLIETAAGIWPTLQLTAALGSPLAHGLATSPWLACDLGDAPVPVRGRVILPERTGSGFRPRTRAAVQAPRR